MRECGEVIVLSLALAVLLPVTLAYWSAQFAAFVISSIAIRVAGRINPRKGISL